MRCVQWGPSPTTEGHGATPGENDPSAACTLSACEENVKVSAHGISARVAYCIHDLLNRVNNQVRLVAGDEVPTLLGDDETPIRDQHGQLLLQREPHCLKGGGGVVRRPVPGSAVGEDDERQRGQGGSGGRRPHLVGARVRVEPLTV